MTPDDQGAQIGLCMIAAVTGMVGVAAGFAIHQRSVFTPWLLVGLVPGIVGLWLTVVR